VTGGSVLERYAPLPRQG